MTVVRVACWFVAYGAAACVGACFAVVGILATANRLVRTYPTTT